MTELTAQAAPNSWLPFVAIIAALLAPTLATVVGVWLANRNAARARKAAENVAKRLEESNATTSTKLDVIHGLVNSRLAAALEKIDRLEQRLFENEGIPPTGEEPPKPPSGSHGYPEGPA